MDVNIGVFDYDFGHPILTQVAICTSFTPSLFGEPLLETLCNP
jgi:hypothetical protein